VAEDHGNTCALNILAPMAQGPTSHHEANISGLQDFLVEGGEACDHACM